MHKAISSVRMKLFIVLGLLAVVASAEPIREKRIFNGRDALVGEAPYMIQFRQIAAGQTFAQHFCGGESLYEVLTTSNLFKFRMNLYLRIACKPFFDCVSCSLL